MAIVVARVVLWSGGCGRHWPGGVRGGSPLEGIASPGVGRTRLEDPYVCGNPGMILNSRYGRAPHLGLWEHLERYYTRLYNCHIHVLAAHIVFPTKGESGIALSRLV